MEDLTQYLLDHQAKTPVETFRQTLRWIRRKVDIPDQTLSDNDFRQAADPNRQAIIAANVFYSYFAFGGSAIKAEQCRRITQQDPQWLHLLLLDMRKVLGLSFQFWIQTDCIRWSWFLAQLVDEQDIINNELAQTQLVLHLLSIMTEEDCLHNREQFGSRQDYDPDAGLSDDSDEEASINSNRVYSLSSGASDVAYWTVIRLLDTPLWKSSDWLSLMLPRLLLSRLAGFFRDPVVTDRMKLLALREVKLSESIQKLAQDSEALDKKPLSILVQFFTQFNGIDASMAVYEQISVRVLAKLLDQSELLTELELKKLRVLSFNFLPLYNLVKRDDRYVIQNFDQIYQLRDNYHELPALSALKISFKSVVRAIDALELEGKHCRQ